MDAFQITLIFVSSTILVFILACYVANACAERGESAKRAAEMNHCLDTLSLSERVILAYQLEHNQKSLIAHIATMPVRALTQKGLLVANGSGDAVGTETFMIPPGAWEALQERAERFLRETAKKTEGKWVTPNLRQALRDGAEICRED